MCCQDVNCKIFAKTVQTKILRINTFKAVAVVVVWIDLNFLIIRGRSQPQTSGRV